MPDPTRQQEPIPPPSPLTLPIDAAGEPFVLKLAERITHSDDPIRTSELLDVASLFYTAVAVVTGSLGGACLFLFLHPSNEKHLAMSLLFLLCAVALGGAIGFVIVAVVFNARGYTRWQQKYRPDEQPAASQLNQ